jgi:hypothetical protein
MASEAMPPISAWTHGRIVIKSKLYAIPPGRASIYGRVLVVVKVIPVQIQRAQMRAQMKEQKCTYIDDCHCLRQTLTCRYVPATDRQCPSDQSVVQHAPLRHSEASRLRSVHWILTLRRSPVLQRQPLGPQPLLSSSCRTYRVGSSTLPRIGHPRQCEE